jgi:hypothetical protein
MANALPRLPLLLSSLLYGLLDSFFYFHNDSLVLNKRRMSKEALIYSIENK